MRTVAKIMDLSGPKDLVLLATKANDCVAAAQDLIPFLKPDSVVVSLQNGISEHALADVLGKERVIGCVVGWGASYYTPGELEVTSYAKLIINSCINSLGVVAGARRGRLLADKSARTIFILLIREALAVAEAMDIEVEPAAGGKLNYYTFMGEGMWANIKRHLTIRMIGFKYRRIKSSSLQSIERGRRTEIDFLNGYICDHGKKHRVPTPVNDAVRKMVHEIEVGSRKMWSAGATGKSNRHSNWSIPGTGIGMQLCPSVSGRQWLTSSLTGSLKAYGSGTTPDMDGLVKIYFERSQSALFPPHPNPLPMEEAAKGNRSL